MSDSAPLPVLSRDGYSRLVELAEDAIISATADGRIVLFNRGAERIFGYHREEVLGRSVETLIPMRYGHAHKQHVTTFAANETEARWMGERSNVYGLRKDGTEFPAEVTISTYRDGDNLLVNAIVRDVTRQKEAENQVKALNQDLEARVAKRTEELQTRTEELRATTQQLWQSAKLASVGELAASIAHELNNPLGTVSLRLETILHRMPDDAPCRPLLAIVEQEVERMASLVSNLLQFSRAHSEQISTVNICDEIVRTAELTDSYLRRRGVKLVHDFQSNPQTIFADRQKLRQVFLNLFTNAGDAMPKGGVLTTRVRQRTLPQRKQVVEIEVADTGHGIPEDILHKVMDPFFTTKDEGKGTGLGLAICRRIVQDHNGSITIESQPGQGTTVRILLPVQEGTNVRRLHT